MQKGRSEKGTQQGNEPRIMIKPIGKYGGLDNIHVALLVLASILIAIVLALAYAKPVAIVAVPNASLNCTYGSYNGTCVLPVHNATQVRLIAEHALASYAIINSSLYVIAYYANVSAMDVSYIPTLGEWYVTLPIANNSVTGHIDYALTIDDRTGKVIGSYFRSFTPGEANNTVVAQGVMEISKGAYCGGTPTKAQWFIDPYAPGSVLSLEVLANIENKFGSNVNASIDLLESQYTTSIEAVQGTSNTLALGQYIFCAQKQGTATFTKFAQTLNAAYGNVYIPMSVLDTVANDSGVNMTRLNSCIGNLTSTTYTAQTLLALHYGIIQTPNVVTDCNYLSTPATESSALCYVNSTLC